MEAHLAFNSSSVRAVTSAKSSFLPSFETTFTIGSFLLISFPSQRSLVPDLTSVTSYGWTLPLSRLISRIVPTQPKHSDISWSRASPRFRYIPCSTIFPSAFRQLPEERYVPQSKVVVWRRRNIYFPCQHFHSNGRHKARRFFAVALNAVVGTHTPTRV